MNDLVDFNNDYELADNPDPRCAVVLVLDASSSMTEIRDGQTQTPLDALNAGLDVLVSELNKDKLAKRRVEISIVTYGTEVTPATPFSTVDNIVLPNLEPSGITSMGAAVNVALDAVEDRKREYKATGTEYYKPWILLITDGLPTDDTATAEARVKQAELEKKLSFFSVGVEGADFERLSRFSNREPLKLDGVKFNELFVWLSASQSAVSASNPGDGVSLPSPAGWANIDA